MKRFAFLIAFVFSVGFVVGQTTVKKVVLQGFWWDYRNSNYPSRWANYLIEMAPRLKAMGVDAVWIPPINKNPAPNYVGYSPFDHYDLGDKFQKNSLRTPFGTKDELLRLIAVLHANGIEVIQDMVMNHCNGAGSASGAGGQDDNSYSMQSNDGYKTFRYVSWETPALNNTAETYWGMKGRWPKNYTNFHPNPGDNCSTGPICEAFFGPDISYEPASFGLALNVPSGSEYYNPTQTSGYMRNGGRDYVMWCKKQTGLDGYRWDAVKHFPTAVQEDYSWNLKYGVPTWAQGGEDMFNVGEWVGGKSELDSYVSAIQQPTGEMMIGTFDFGLRAFDSGGGLYGLITGNGGFNMASLPGAQQNNRVHFYAASNKYVHRTVTFVNNHDTFRPQLSSTGNYTGWNSGNELSPHIEPNDTRLSAAYAAIIAMDGNPQIFFEDLFNIGYDGNRYTHDPKSETELPARSDIENLIWCHQNLDFKSGAYLVPFQSDDYLVIERAGKAVIGITDNYNNWQENGVQTSFPIGTVLRDYSNASTNTVTVGPSGWVNIKTPPCNATSNPAGRKGYSVWAPDGQQNDQYEPPRAHETIQEWEMADDLGDKHPSSLTQGGALPANSTSHRVVGKIYAQAGTPITYILYPEVAAQGKHMGLYSLSGELIDEISGNGTLEATYTPTTTEWLAIKIRKTEATGNKQRCWVNVTYTAPAIIENTADSPADNTVSIWTGSGGNTTWNNPYNWEEGQVPYPTSTVIISGFNQPQPVITNNVTIDCLQLTDDAVLTVDGSLTINCNPDIEGGSIQGNGTVGTENINRPNIRFEAVPNPTDGRVHIQAVGVWSATEQIQALVTDAAGRRICQLSGNLEAINTQLEQIMPQQSAGMYYIRIAHERTIFQTHIVKF